MFEGEWVILKRRVEIGLGKMPRIAGFCKETKVRKIKSTDQVTLFFENRLCCPFPVGGVDKHDTQKQYHERQIK